MKLTKDEIARARDASPMELFAQGIRSKETLEKYSRTLRQVTCEFLRSDPLLFFKPAHPTFQARFRQAACSASHNSL